MNPFPISNFIFQVKPTKAMAQKIILPVLVFLLTGFTTQLPYEINDTVKDFSLVNAIDNSTISLSSYTKSKAVVIIFSSPSCAFSKIYDERLVNLAKEYKDKEVSFIFINPNNPSANPEDSKEAMSKRAVEKGYIFPYLIDNRQETADVLGATKTPEAFLMKNVNGSFVLKYRGAIDDNPQLASEVRATFLKDAIDAVLINAPVKITTRKATGCMIRK